MALLRMDNILVVVDDLDTVKAFFIELGMTLEGEIPLEGSWIDQIVGLENVRSQVVFLRSPDGHGLVQLAKFHSPEVAHSSSPRVPMNTLGIRRMVFTVSELDDLLARLRTHGAELVGGIAVYEDLFRICHVYGPENILIGLVEPIK